MSPYLIYIGDETVPENKNEAQRLKAKVARCSIIGKLYKRSFSDPYLKCILDDKIKLALNELQEGQFGIVRVEEVCQHDTHRGLLLANT